MTIWIHFMNYYVCSFLFLVILRTPVRVHPAHHLYAINLQNSLHWQIMIITFLWFILLSRKCSFNFQAACMFECVLLRERERKSVDLIQFNFKWKIRPTHNFNRFRLTQSFWASPILFIPSHSIHSPISNSYVWSNQILSNTRHHYKNHHHHRHLFLVLL